MKRLTCEMCGGIDLIKQDGVFVCQNCGCKYSIEEAKRMMIEGTVDVQGTVKVDNSAFVEKYLENARRAKAKEDWEGTEKYYNLVEQNDPNNIEAIFYSAYGKAKASLVDSDIYKRQAVFKVLTNCVSIIDDRYQVEDKQNNKEAIGSIATDLLKLFRSAFVFTQWKNQYGEVTKTNRDETYYLFIALIDAFHHTMLNIEAKDPEPYIYEIFIAFAQSCRMLSFEGYYMGMYYKIYDGWINHQKAELKQKKITAYWVEHAQEKADLEQEKEDLKVKIENWNAEVSALPETQAEMQIEAMIATLQQKKAALGLFKVKEKKALQEQIDNLTSGELEKAKTKKSAVAAPILARIRSASTRISKIDGELTKER